MIHVYRIQPYLDDRVKVVRLAPDRAVLARCPPRDALGVVAADALRAATKTTALRFAGHRADPKSVFYVYDAPDKASASIAITRAAGPPAGEGCRLGGLPATVFPFRHG